MFSPPRSHLPSSSAQGGDSSPTILVSGHFAHFAELNGTTLETQRTIPTPLQEKNSRVSSVTSPDGRILIAVSQGGLGGTGSSTVSTFDFANGEPISVFHGHHRGDVRGLECLSPGGSSDLTKSGPCIVSGSGPRVVYVWNGMTGETISKLTDAPDTIYRIRSLPPQWSSSTEILVGGFNGFLGLYNLDRRLLVHQFEGHERENVQCISFDEERRIIVSVDNGFSSKQLKLWDYNTKECRKTIASGFGYSVCCSANLIAVGRNRIVDFWDIRNLNTKLREVKVSTNAVDDICAVNPPSSSPSFPSFVAVSEGAEDNVALLTSESLNARITLLGQCFGCCCVDPNPSSAPVAFSLPPAPPPIPDDQVPAHALVLGASASRGETPDFDKWPRDSVIRDLDNICTLFRTVHVQITELVCRQWLSKKKVMKSLRKFFADATRYLCIVYFTGHGRDGGEGSRGDWILHEENRDGSKTKECFTYSEFRDLWYACRGRNPSRRCLLILEACYSGEWVRKLSLEEDKRGLYIQSSCTENEKGRAFENDRSGGEKGGWFTNWWRGEVFRLYKDFYTAERAERDSGIRAIQERPPDTAMFEVGDHSPLRGRQHPMCSSRRAFVFKCQANDERSVLYFGGRMFAVDHRGEETADDGDESMCFVVWD